MLEPYKTEHVQILNLNAKIYPITSRVFLLKLSLPFSIVACTFHSRRRWSSFLLIYTRRSSFIKFQTCPSLWKLSISFFFFFFFFFFFSPTFLFLNFLKKKNFFFFFFFFKIKTHFFFFFVFFFFFKGTPRPKNGGVWWGLKFTKF